MSILRAAVACVVVALLVGGAGHGGSSAGPAREIVFGVIAPLTGSKAEQGMQFKEGAEVAVAEINVGARVLDRKIRPEILDDRGLPNEAASAAQKLAANPDVVACIGPSSTASSSAAIPIFERARITCISPSASTATLVTKNRFCGFIYLGPARMSYTEILIVGLSAVLMIGLQIFVRYTRWGRAMRATAQNPLAAALMGIDVHMTVRMIFGIGSALAAVAGMLMGVYYNFAHPSMGFLPGIKGFVAAVLGGMGSVLGAGLGGIVLGMAEVLGGSYVSFAYQDAIAFAILIIIFLVRPQGILGTRTQEKV